MNSSTQAKRDAIFAATHPILMGIVNVTPDSFSDGGRFMAPDAALAEMRRHLAGGAAMIDLGAESTRPGHTPVAESEERKRLTPVLSALVQATEVAVSIDTTKALIAAGALDAGVTFINDQWGLQGDPAMAEIVASGEAGLIAMYNRTTIEPDLDIVADMHRFFDRTLAIAAKAGLPHARVILDPGIGFGKSKVQNLTILGAGIRSLQAYGRPILVGASRKSLFAALIGATAVEDRLVGTLAAHLSARAHGATLFRVHDCAPHRDAFAVQDAIAMQDAIARG